jgi:2-polyprenyl-3-methyl-5-hydroxy-6-metoxy-1,4-benzoquinol methylase
VGGITLPLAAMGCRVRAIDIDEEDAMELERE